MTAPREVRFKCAKCGDVNVAQYDPKGPVASGQRGSDRRRFFKCANPDCGQWNGVEVPDERAPDAPR